MSPTDLTNRLKAEAERVGFSLTGICEAVAAPGFERLRQWIDDGMAGEMSYLSDRLDAYSHPRHVLDGVRSILMLGMHYRTLPSNEPNAGEAKVSRYAWGKKDYHDVIHGRLKSLIRYVKDLAPGAIARGVVDTAPLLERDFATLAGIGWIGKHTLLINKTAGSLFFLAAVLTDLQLDIDSPFETQHCGTCTACLDACPTDAFPKPYVLDASKCISYLTIELRNPIPLELRAGVGQWLFGCDVCQDVCPWNRRAPMSQVVEFAPLEEMNPVELASLFAMSDDEFRQRFRATPLWRSRRRGILRNAAIVLGNQRNAENIGILVGGLQDDEALVRGACAWALGQFGNPVALRALLDRRPLERNDDVLRELAQAIGGRQI